MLLTEMYFSGKKRSTPLIFLLRSPQKIFASRSNCEMYADKLLHFQVMKSLWYKQKTQSKKVKCRGFFSLQGGGSLFIYFTKRVNLMLTKSRFAHELFCWISSSSYCIFSTSVLCNIARKVRITTFVMKKRMFYVSSVRFNRISIDPSQWVIQEQLALP